MEKTFNLLEECSLLRWDEEIKDFLTPIDCGEKDLNEFFANDAILYSKELLGKTYVWVTDEEPIRIVASFQISL